MNQAPESRAIRQSSGDLRFPGGVALALLVACCAAINAYSYVMVSAIPILQSDAWGFLDSFLGRFIEHGFSWMDLFVQVNTSSTNLPLYKLFLFFHTHFFGMDFRLEGILGVISAVGLVIVITRAATSSIMRQWRGPECWLLAALMLTVLSLNSTTIYTWPLVTQWFLSLLIAVVYFWIVLAYKHSNVRVLAASFILGILLDEVAFPVFSAALGALLLSKPPDGAKDAWRFAAFGGAGLLATRIFYQIVQHVSTIKAVSNEAHRSFSALLDPGAWQAVAIPLSDALMHQGNQVELLGSDAPTFAAITAIIFVCAHLWFWWRCIFARSSGLEGYVAITYMAMAVMLFFYALVLGLVLQRVSDYGFAYLHQPRYVIFYQLHVVALALLVYREVTSIGQGTRLRKIAQAAIVICILAFGVLQFRLSTLAWEHSKYVSKYVENAALSLGRLAAEPELELDCVDTLKICKYPVEKRRAIMNMLIRYRLNLFSPEFQAFHRLYPFAQGRHEEIYAPHAPAQAIAP